MDDRSLVLYQKKVWGLIYKIIRKDRRNIVNYSKSVNIYRKDVIEDWNIWGEDFN